MAKDNRFRTWAFVVYPDSAPANWRELLDSRHVAWYESPLHDKDVNPTGEKKKAHWHVMFHFAGKKSFEQVEEVSKSVNATIPIHVDEAKGMLRYFAHLDNPEKASYDPKDIIPHCGADMSYLTAPTGSERHKFINEMRTYCRDNDISEFCDLLDYAAEHHEMDWFPLLCDSCAYIMEKYLASLRNKPRVRTDTGEIVESASDQKRK